ncbi:hypothetical protein JB92DRAFT_3153418 [Gautieria morchelliformis]|nr:hypothetical protein JB92DRAFT_3153418 [Gautieria morchelliformis]
MLSSIQCVCVALRGILRPVQGLSPHLPDMQTRGHVIKKRVGWSLMEPEAWVRVGRATAWIRWAGSALVHVPVRVGLEGEVEAAGGPIGEVRGMPVGMAPCRGRGTVRNPSRRGYGSEYGRAGVDIGKTGWNVVASILFGGGWRDGGMVTNNGRALVDRTWSPGRTSKGGLCSGVGCDTRMNRTTTG